MLYNFRVDPYGNQFRAHIQFQLFAGAGYGAETWVTGPSVIADDPEEAVRLAKTLTVSGLRTAADGLK